MYKKFIVLITILTLSILSACGRADPQSPAADLSAALTAEYSHLSEAVNSETSALSAEDRSEDSDISRTESGISGVASADEMAEVKNVAEEGMVPVYADEIENGVYNITVESSSSMFRITDCTLAVSDNSMSAVMTMGGTGYLNLYMGTGEQAVSADPSDYIPFKETADGKHTFTIPVEALDKEIPCSAFSKRKEQWYDRTLLFRADSLPPNALKSASFTDPADLNLANGTYTAEVSLKGGSGRATVSSPARLTVEDGKVTAEIIWSSPNYDFMMVDGERCEPVNKEGNSVFLIPVKGFDYSMPVSADTTAMSTPHLIDYTLTFDSSTIQQD